MGKIIIRRNKLRIALACVSLVLAGCGGASIGYGVYMKCKSAFAQELLAGAWSNVLAGKKSVKPWPWADTKPCALLAVPALGIKQIVLEGGSGRTLAFGPGHIDGSAMPGMKGNCAIIGHRDTSFAFLARLSPGDTIFLYSKSSMRHRYIVSFTRRVDANDVWVTAKTDEPELTLITCYPFDSPFPGSGRFVVRAFLETD
jgi:sortase A